MHTVFFISVKSIIYTVLKELRFNVREPVRDKNEYGFRASSVQVVQFLVLVRLNPKILHFILSECLTSGFIAWCG